MDTRLSDMAYMNYAVNILLDIPRQAWDMNAKSLFTLKEIYTI